MGERKPDPVILAILDHLFELTQIDPTHVQPDERLQRDLGLTSTQVHTLLWRSAQSLNLNVPFEACRVGDLSSREIETLLKKWQCSSEETNWGGFGRVA